MSTKKIVNFIIVIWASILIGSCKKEISQVNLTLSSTPANGGSVSPSSGSHKMGSIVRILATPTAEYIFKGWEGDYMGNSNPADILMNGDKNITAIFERREYPLTIKIAQGGTVKEEVIKKAPASTNYISGTTVRLTPIPADGYLFTRWSGDDTSTKSPLDLIITKPTNLECHFEKLQIVSLRLQNPIDTLVISKKHKYQVKGVYSNGSLIDLSDSVIIKSDTQHVTIRSNNIIGAKSGVVNVSITYKNLKIEDSFYVNYYEETLKTAAEFLKKNNHSSDVINVPIVIINFHPTLDGVSADPRRYVDASSIKEGYFSYYNLDRNVCNQLKDNEICQTETLDMYKQRAQDLHSLTKFGIEEGSKFRAFNNSSAKQTVNIEVVKYFNFYELKTKVYRGRVVPQPDYQDLFAKINLETLVNSFGVKEVWICLSPLSTEYPIIQDGSISKEFLLNFPESNMSSPYGDISNSERIDEDLPKYNRTYVVYGMNIDRGPSEALHNRGHQIESQLSFIEKDKQNSNELFWNKFVGMRSGNIGPLGRAGATHFPPNTNIDYDYSNNNLFDSDIKDWKPDGGEKSKINADTWTKIPYNFPKNIFWTTKGDNVERDSGYKWLIYWFQSFPNSNSNIPYTTNVGKKTILTNWWDIFYNWDDAISKKKTLWIE